MEHEREKSTWGLLICPKHFHEIQLIFQLKCPKKLRLIFSPLNRHSKIIENVIEWDDKKKTSTNIMFKLISCGKYNFFFYNQLPFIKQTHITKNHVNCMKVNTWAICIWSQQILHILKSILKNRENVVSNQAIGFSKNTITSNENQHPDENHTHTQTHKYLPCCRTCYNVQHTKHASKPSFSLFTWDTYTRLICTITKICYPSVF